MKTISVIIPCRNEEKYIVDCLHSVLYNDYPKELTEIFVVDGNSIDNTKKIVEEFSLKFPIVKLLINRDKIVPLAMNFAIRVASGDLIIRLDAHSKIPNNYFSELVRASDKFDADNIGTCWITDVKNKNPKSNAIKKVLSNKFGIGNSLFRIGVNEPQEVDTVPFGCFKKEVFGKVGLFNKYLKRNQDIELNKRIARAGGKVILISEVKSTYFARETFIELAENNFGNGLWNILTVYITKKFSSLSLRHFIPIIFLLSLILPLIGMIFNSIVGIISLLSLISYLTLISFISYNLKDKTTSFIYIFISFLVLHFSYAAGSLLGLLRLDYLFKRV